MSAGPKQPDRDPAEIWRERLIGQGFIFDYHGHPIMEPRDLFAAAALTGLLAGPANIGRQPEKLSYAIADKMLEARNA